MDETETKALNRKRRQFLRAAGGAGALAVLAAQDAQAEAAPAAPPAPEPARQAGYHETEHIRTYYRTAAYW
jgi:hypothetical protein